MVEGGELQLVGREPAQLALQHLFDVLLEGFRVQGLQGYLTCKKMHSPRTLLQAYT